MTIIGRRYPRLLAYPHRKLGSLLTRRFYSCSTRSSLLGVLWTIVEHRGFWRLIACHLPPPYSVALKLIIRLRPPANCLVPSLDVDARAYSLPTYAHIHTYARTDTF